MSNEKQKQPENKQEEEDCPELSPEALAKLRAEGIDLEHPTLDQMYPEILDREGNDLSLMSAKEMETWATYWRVRKYLWDTYPLPKKADSTSQPSQPQEQKEDPDVDIPKAAQDPKAQEYLGALDKAFKIYNKIQVLQKQATPFEKICVRYYSFIAYNWTNAPSAKLFRSELTESDLFEAVDAYFKICRKYHVATFEEPYYFLSEQQRLNMKLEADELKRTGGYSEIEIHVSNLEAFL
jgi:hypothetical protein